MGGFAPSGGDTVPALLTALLATDPTRPVLTFYDDATGERTELSGATLENWVAKCANLLVDGCGLGAGDRAAIWLPPHWQGAAVLLGCWTAGLTVGYGEPTADRAAVEFASTQAVEAGAPVSGGDRFVLNLHPMGMPSESVPAGWVDFITEVRGHGDRFAGPLPGPDDQAWVDVSGQPLTQAALVALGRSHAARLGIDAGERVLVDADVYPYPVDWLVAPLSVGATVVLCTHTDPAKLAGRAESENATIVGPVPTEPA